MPFVVVLPMRGGYNAPMDAPYSTEGNARPAIPPRVDGDVPAELPHDPLSHDSTEDQRAPNGLAILASSPVYRVCAVTFGSFLAVNVMLTTGLSNVRYPDSIISVLVGLATGAVVAQMVLHSIWTVFCWWDRTRRLLVSVLSALILYLSLFAKPLFDTDAGAYRWNEAASMLLCLPLFLLSVQLPIRALKAFRGWEIVAIAADANALRKRKSGILDLLLITGAIGIAMALTRLVGTTLMGTSNGSMFVLQMVTVAAVMSILSLLTSVIALLGTMRAANVAVGTLAAVGTQLVLCVGWYVVMCTLTHEIPPVEFVAALVSFVVGCGVSIYAPLIYLRTRGYRLRRPNVEPETW